MSAGRWVRSRAVTAPQLRASVAIWTLLVLSLIAFSVPTYFSIRSRWLDYTYSHGYLVLAVTVLLVVREVRRAPLALSSPSVGGLLLLVIAGGGVLAAHAATTAFVAQMLLPFVWFASVWTVAGWREARRFMWPIAYLYFAIPWWDAINEILQHVTVAVVGAAVRVAGIPAFIDGNFIHIPSGTFEVAGGCSGLHFVIVGLAIGVLSSLLHHESRMSRSLLVITALMLSLLANWLRVFAIIVAGYQTDMQHYLIVEDHYYFGWAVFLVCLLPLFLMDRRLQVAWPEEADARRSAELRPRFVVATSPWMLIAAFGVLVTGAWLGQQIAAGDVSAPVSARAIDLPMSGGWRRARNWDGVTRPVFVGADAEASAWYARPGLEMAVYAAYYSTQGERREIVNYASKPAGESGDVVATADREAVTPSGAVLPFTEYVVADAGGRRLVWQQLRVSGVATRDQWVAKLLQAAGVLSGRRDAQAIVIAVRCGSDCETALRTLADNAGAVAASIHACADRLAAVGVSHGITRSCHDS